MSPLISNFDLPSVCEFVCMSRSGNLLLSWKLNYEQETQVMSEVQGQGGRRLRSVRAGGGGDGAFRWRPKHVFLCQEEKMKLI